MKRLPTLCLVMALLVVLTACGGVDFNFSGTSPFRNIRDDAVTSAVDEKVAQLADGHNISVGVMRDRQAYFHSVGEGMGEHTPIHVGKLSNIFVGLLISNFEDNGWLNRNEKIADWIKSPALLPEGSQNITVMEAACGSTGLSEAERDSKGYYTSGMMYRQLENTQLTEEDGETDTTSLGYALLCECLRQSYNMNADFSNLVNNQVLAKMDLQESDFYRRDILAAYDGFESTCYDLMKVVGYCGGMLSADEVLDRTVQGALVWTVDAAPVTPAYSVDIEGDHSVYFKSASAEEGSAYIAFIPDLGVGVTAVSDSEIDLEALGRELLDIIKG